MRQAFAALIMSGHTVSRTQASAVWIAGESSRCVHFWQSGHWPLRNCWLALRLLVGPREIANETWPHRKEEFTGYLSREAVKWFLLAFLWGTYEPPQSLTSICRLLDIRENERCNTFMLRCILLRGFHNIALLVSGPGSQNHCSYYIFGLMVLTVVIKLLVIVIELFPLGFVPDGRNVHASNQRP